MTTAADILETMRAMEDEAQRRVLGRFFKTAPGEYGEGDRFLGLRVPQTRGIVKECRLDVPLSEIEALLRSPWHEARLAGFLLLVEEMKDATPRRGEQPVSRAGRRDEISRFYLAHARCANNWDLVDLSCYKVLGPWLSLPCADGGMPERGVLDALAGNDNLWEQRIAIVTTMAFVRAGCFADTLRISDKLLGHPHDLIHKAVGWMLREVGKRDIDTLRGYLEANVGRMHRTTLRYAIERMSADERGYFMRR